MDATNSVSEVTRRNIIDYIVASETEWAGRLDEDEFLARLYDLSQMPSTDSRMRTAKGDIRQHRINWQDWELDWVFTDSRFNLLKASDDSFLRFLCETVHPVVRDPDLSPALVAQYNKRLQADDWKLVQTGDIAGKPIYGAVRLNA